LKDVTTHFGGEYARKSESGRQNFKTMVKEDSISVLGNEVAGAERFLSVIREKLYHDNNERKLFRLDCPPRVKFCNLDLTSLS
jgi:hypothetical protein